MEQHGTLVAKQIGIGWKDVGIVVYGEKWYKKKAQEYVSSHSVFLEVCAERYFSFEKSLSFIGYKKM